MTGPKGRTCINEGNVLPKRSPRELLSCSQRMKLQREGTVYEAKTEPPPNAEFVGIQYSLDLPSFRIIRIDLGCL